MLVVGRETIKPPVKLSGDCVLLPFIDTVASVTNDALTQMPLQFIYLSAPVVSASFVISPFPVGSSLTIRTCDERELGAFIFHSPFPPPPLPPPYSAPPIISPHQPVWLLPLTVN